MNNHRQTEQAPGTPETKTIQVKLVLLGEAAVGKSSLVLRLVNNEFQENKEPTIGAAFLTQKIQAEDKVIKFEIWDTAGQERFHSLAPMYYRNAQAAIVVYDVTRRSSLDKAKSWVKELQRQASPNIVIAFVGNKIDLAKRSDTDESGDQNDGKFDTDDEGQDSNIDNEEDVNSREVSTKEASMYAKNAGLIFFETSAKNNTNVTETFYEIAKNLPFDQIIASQQALRGAQLNSGSVNVSRQNQGGFSFGGSDQGDEGSNKCAC